MADKRPLTNQAGELKEIPASDTLFADSLKVIGSAIFNSGLGDNDFNIKKLTSGDAYIYDAGDDTHTLDGDVTITSGSILDFGSTVSDDKIHLWKNGASKYGFGIRASELINYVEASGSKHTWGHMLGGSTYVQRMSLDSNGLHATTGITSASTLALANLAPDSLMHIRSSTSGEGSGLKLSSNSGNKNANIFINNTGDVILGKNNQISTGGNLQLLDDGNVAVPNGVIFNDNRGDNDFTVNKNTSGTAYIYDAGLDTHTFGGDATFLEGAGGGATANSQAHNLVISSDQTNSGMSILAPAGGNGNIYFGEDTNALAAKLQYIGSVNALRLEADGNANIEVRQSLVTVNTEQVDVDFRILKNTSGIAYIYNAGAVSHTFSGDMGFFDATPVSQASHIADPTGGATVDAEARTAIDAILVVIENLGLTATS